MLVISSKVGPIKYDRVWFAEVDDELKRKSSGAVSRILRSQNSPPVEKNYIIDSGYTILTDLRESEEELLQKTRKKVRYEINRARKEGIAIDYYESKDLENNSLISEFENAYLNFCKTINNADVLKAYSESKIKSYISNKCILVSTAIKDKCTVYHVYVFDEKNVVLVYSVSDFRDKDVDQYVSGMANKLLHYEDMLYFKRKGIVNYDWGNISSKEAPNEIDNFKLSFGGEITQYYNTYIPKNFLGNIVLYLYKKIRR